MKERFSTALHNYYEGFMDLLPDLVISIIILLITLLLANKFSSIVHIRILKGSDQPLLQKFISHFVKTVIIIFGLAIVLRTLGLGDIAGSLIAGAGVSAIILGFAFKDIGENFLTGTILAFSRPFRIGDIIRNVDWEGKIVGMSIRHSHIKTYDGKDVYIPNSLIIKHPLVNFTRDGFLRLEFTVGIDYQDDVENAQQVILVALHHIDGVLHNKPPIVTIDALATSTVNLKVLYWINTFDDRFSLRGMKRRVINKVKWELLEKGFILPADIMGLKIFQDNEPIPMHILQDGHTPKKS